jgi:hypothetical protein
MAQKSHPWGYLLGNDDAASCRKRQSLMRIENRDYVNASAMIHAAEGRYDLAVMDFKRALAMESSDALSNDKERALGDLLLPLLTRQKYRKALQGTNIGDMIHCQVDFLRHSPKRTLTLSRRILGIRSDPEMLFLQGLILETVDNKESMRLYQEGVAKALSQGLPAERVGDYDVFRLAGSDFLRSTVILKQRQDPRLLFAEEEQTKLAHRQLAKYGIRLVRVLGKTCSVGNRHILPLLYAEGSDLGASDNPQHYAGAAYSLGIIHAGMPCASYAGTFPAKRIDALDALVANSAFAVNVLSELAHAGYALVFNKDAHPGNWRVSEDGGVTAIDFYAKYASTPHNELCKLLFQRRRWDDVGAMSMLAAEHYCKGRRDGGKPLPADGTPKLFHAVLRAAPLRAASFVGFVSNRESRRDEQVGFVENALLALEASEQRPESAAARQYLTALRSALG